MRIYIATHGSFSKALVETIELIIGNQRRIDYFMMEKDKSLEVASEEIENYLNANQDEDLFVFTDLKGGSVCNLLSTYLLKGYKFELTAGVNLPMILTFLLETSSKQGLTKALDAGREGIVDVGSIILSEEMDFNDDFINED